MADLTVAETARADQLRAALKEAMETPCECGECPTEEWFLSALAMSDEELLAWFDTLT